MKQTITSTQRAYITVNTSRTLQDAIEQQDASILSIVSANMDNYPGWTYVGQATVTIEVEVAPEEVVASQVSEFKQLIEKINLDAADKIAEINEQISKLTAIGYSQSADINIVATEITGEL